MAVYALSATVWMPNVVTRNEAQFGFFGVALALVTWFSGAAIGILIGACAGAVFAEDPGITRDVHPRRPAERPRSGARPALPPPAARAQPPRRIPTGRRRLTQLPATRSSSATAWLHRVAGDDGGHALGAGTRLVVGEQVARRGGERVDTGISRKHASRAEAFDHCRVEELVPTERQAEQRHAVTECRHHRAHAPRA